MLAALALTLAGCGCGDDQPPDPMDAAADTGRRDAVVDSSSDTRVDAARDSAADAATDSGSDAGPGDPRWLSLPGLPSGCAIERVENPEVLFTPEWRSCGDGCEYLAPEDRFQRSYANVAWHDGTRGWIVVVQSSDADHREVLFAPTDGPAVAGWRGPNAAEPGVCQVGPYGFGGNSAAFGVQTYGDGLPTQFRVYHAPISEIGAVTEPISVRGSVDVGGLGVQTLDVSDTTVAALVQPSGLVLVLEGGEERVLLGPSGYNPQLAQVVGRSVWFEEWGHPTSLVVGTVDTSAEYFRRNLPHDVFILGTDGSQMAWLQGYDWGGVGAQYSRIELWTADYTDDASALSPRLVREIPGWGQAEMGGGVYAFPSGELGGLDPRVDLYDLSDGRRRTFRSPSGASLVMDVLYLTEEEMLLDGRYDTRPALFRIQLSSIPYEE